MSLEEVTKRHGNDVALAVDGVGMQVAPGGVAVIGRPRSGKSVLLSLIASLDGVFKAIEMTKRQ